MTRRLLLRRSLGLLTLIGAVIVGLYWVGHSETVLRWALTRAASALPGKLDIEGVHGSLTEPVTVDRLRYTSDPLTVEAHHVALSWSPVTLLVARRVWLQELRIAELTVALASSGNSAQPTKLPMDLGLPIPVRLDRLQIDRLSVQPGPGAVVFSAAVLAYDGDARGHRLRLERLRSPWGEIDGELRLVAQAPYGLTGRAQFKGALREDWPVSLQLKLGGTLQLIDTAALVELRGTPLDGTAHIAPFASDWLRQLTAHGAALDLKRFFDEAPSTALEVTFKGRGVDVGGIEGELSARNALAGTIDRDRLPLRNLVGHLRLNSDLVQITDAALDFGTAGSARGAATAGASGIVADLQVSDLDLRSLHVALRRTRLTGTLSATFDSSGQSYRGTLSQDRVRLGFSARQQQDMLNVDSLLAQAGTARLSARGKLSLSRPNRFSAQAELLRFDPAAFGDFPAANINGNFTADGQLRPTWEVALAYRLANGTFRGQPLSGQGRLTLLANRVKEASARLILGRNRVELSGAFGLPGDAMNVDVDAQALQAVGPEWAGNARLSGRVDGTWSQPGGELTFSARALKMPGGYSLGTLEGRGKLERLDDPRFDLQARAQALTLGTQRWNSVAIASGGSFAHHDIRIQASGMEMQWEGHGEGAWSYPQRAWSGRVIELRNQGRYPIKLAAPMSLSVAPERVAFGPAELQVLGGKIGIGETRYGSGELASSGSITGVSAAQLLEWMRYSQPVRESLLLGGRWNITAREHLDANIELFREAGDVEVVADEERLNLGLHQLAARVDIVQDRVSAEASAESSAVGHVTASLVTRVEERDGKWGVAGEAPISGSTHADVGSIRSIVALFNRSVAIDGKLALDARIGGTVAEPEVGGRADVQGLSIEQIDSGVLLHDGVLHATFAGRELEVSSFAITGGKGQLSATGRAASREGHLSAAIDWAAKEFTAVQKPGLLLTVAGKGTVSVKDDRLAVDGALRVERGRIELRDGSMPALGDDVIVAGAKPRAAAAAQVSSPAIDLDLDLGRDFLVQGRGLDARVEGHLKLQSPGNAPVTAVGEIAVARGTYDAYGRKLDIEKGKLHFAGPVDNPALEIRAMRTNQQVEAGVEITGTARAPQVRLVSTPEVPDSEKAAWLVLGHKVDSKNHGDVQALQSSAAVLMAGAGTSSQQAKIARGLGLDEMSMTPSTSATGGTTAVVTVAKRISDNVYVTFEQSLDAASKVMRVNYQLSRRWTLRTETGTSEAVGLFYSLSFD
jgi:translocation and assembly module TamB